MYERRVRWVGKTDARRKTGDVAWLQLWNEPVRQVLSAVSQYLASRHAVHGLCEWECSTCARFVIDATVLTELVSRASEPCELGLVCFSSKNAVTFWPLTHSTVKDHRRRSLWGTEKVPPQILAPRGTLWIVPPQNFCRHILLDPS